MRSGACSVRADTCVEVAFGRRLLPGGCGRWGEGEGRGGLDYSKRLSEAATVWGMRSVACRRRSAERHPGAEKGVGAAPVRESAVRHCAGAGERRAVSGVTADRAVQGCRARLGWAAQR